MAPPQSLPIGISLSADVEERGDGRKPYRARVRWVDPTTRRRRSLSESVETPEEAANWIEGMRRAARGGIDPIAATMNLGHYGDAVMPLAMRGLEKKTLDPYMAGWRRRVVWLLNGSSTSSGPTPSRRRSAFSGGRASTCSS